MSFLPRLQRQQIYEQETRTGVLRETWRWYESIYSMLGKAAGVAWEIVSKAGSKLTDIETRPHSDLQTIEGTGTRHITTTENAEITALDGLTAGIVAKTGDAAYSARTITGTAGEIEVANGNGGSDNPTIGLPTTISTTRRFGGVANYTEFEATATGKQEGFMVHAGDARYWTDIDFPIIIRTTGANIPTLTTLNGNITMPQWAVNDFNVCESQELIHAWDEGTTCYWHIHLTTNGIDATNRYVNFEIEYGYNNGNNTSWTFPTVITSGDLLIPASTPDKTMLILSIGNFTPSSAKIGAHVVARLKRIASTGTAPTNNPWVAMLQMHILCNSEGSRTIGTK